MEEPQGGAQLYIGPKEDRLPGRQVGVGMTRPPVEPDSLPENEDLKLLRRAAGGDGKAFHALLDRHADRLFRLAYSLLGNAADAQDVVQEAWAGAYRGLGGFEGRSSVNTWLTRIVVLQAAKWRRDHKRRFEPMGATEGRASEEQGSEAVERRIDVRAALEKLTPEHREVLVLREYEQMSYEEMAEALGVPRGTVESRLYRARAELRERLKAYLT
jgi:RNA polymerase sigma-70 factor (ECF subfamily)